MRRQPPRDYLDNKLNIIAMKKHHTRSSKGMDWKFDNRFEEIFESVEEEQMLLS